MAMQRHNRLSAYALLTGGVLALVANAMTPRISDTAKGYVELATSKRWLVANVMLFVALTLVVAGLARVANTLGERTSELADFGRVAVIAGGAAALVQLAVETSALKHQAEIWYHTPQGTTDFAMTYWAANSVDHLNAALQVTWDILLVGLAPALLGAAMLRSTMFSRPIAVFGIASGTAALVVSYLLLVNDNRDRLDIPFAIASVAVTLWVITCGWQLRDGAEPPRLR